MPERQARGRAVRALAVAVPALVLLALVAVRDASAALALAGLGALVAGVIVLARPAGRSRRGRGGVLAVLALGSGVLFLGGTAVGAPGPPALDLQARVAPVARPGAAAALAALPVKGAAPMTGYQRTARFGAAWLDVDRNGCDTRNDVLRRDLVDRRESRCTVRSGVLRDPYSGRTVDFVRGERTSAAVQIDHVVSLADAWRTGAQRLPQARRIALANDPVNLFAVDGPTNTAKRDGDAATWLPKRKAFRCTYVAHQIAVKRAYGLWVVPAERAAMARVLAACPGQRLPAASTVSRAPAPPKAAPSEPPQAAPSPPSSGHPAVRVVTPGAFCTPPGASGRTAAGTPMTCRAAGGESRARWRSAG